MFAVTCRSLHTVIMKNRIIILILFSIQSIQLFAQVEGIVINKGKWQKNSLKEKSINEDLAIELTLSY